MITNIVASIVVSMVTNVTHISNSTKTTVKQVTTLSFDFEGQHYDVSKEKVIMVKERDK